MSKRLTRRAISAVRRTRPGPAGVWRPRLRLWFDIAGRGTLGPGKLALLRAITATGSLAAAARQLHMSYRLAWGHLRLIEQRTGLTVVERQRGGRLGGGTFLTAEGHALLARYGALRGDIEAYAEAAFFRHFGHRAGAGSAAPRATPVRDAPVLGGVLIGGRSTRMGAPKTALPVGGATLLEHVIDVLARHVQRVLLLGDCPTPAAASACARLPDPPGLSGPLAGILAALRWAPDACWVVASCDLPLLRPDAIAWLLAQRALGRAAILPRLAAQRVEPLLAVYEPEARPLLEQLVAAGCLAPHRLADQPAVHTPTPPQRLRDCWTNVNTPEEFRRVSARRGRARRGGGRRG